MNQPLSTLPEITLVKGTVNEQKTQEQLLRLFAQYPLDKWRYTGKVQIEEGVLPHSHPLLTLHTQYLNDDEQLLGTYIHEQIHWFLLLAEKFERGEQAKDEFLQKYPDLPVKPPEGCGNKFSTYLHIPVNYLEYLGLIELLGAAQARNVLERKSYYTKIYDLVLKESERIGEVMTRYELIPGERPLEELVFLGFWRSMAATWWHTLTRRRLDRD